MATFNIYFSDLNEEAQQELLNFVGVEKPEDMNWDIDMCQIAMYDDEYATRDRKYRGDYI